MPELVARCFRVEPELPAGLTPATDADLETLADRVLADAGGAPMWVFAYGSLIWKPVFPPEAVRRGSATGWHRAFTLRIKSFRATPERPGLMMALARGGRCNGLLLRLPETERREALIALLRREVPFREVISMVRWIAVAGQDGPVRSLVFWAGSLPSFTIAELPPEATARQLAQACGHAGSCADYLYQTIVHLEAHGIRDRNLWRLQALVAAEIESWDA